MPIGKLGNSPSNSVPDLNELDSNPQSVANATGDSGQTGGIGHRAVQFLRNISSSIREVADSFADAIEKRFSGSAKDNLKSLFNRSPRQIDTPPSASSFKSYVGGDYAQIDELRTEALENQTYGATGNYAVTGDYERSDDYALADEPTYASLSEVRTQPAAKELKSSPDYQNVASQAELDAEEYIAADFASDDYVEAAPDEIYASLAEISTEPTYASLSEISTEGFGGFTPDSTQPADTNFYEKVDSHSSPATKQALSFIRHAIDHHGAAGGKALVDAGILGIFSDKFGAKSKRIIGQVTPELFNTFQVKLKEAKAANAAKVAAGFAPSASKIKFDRYNSDNANSPIHAVLQKAVFASSPRLADKAKWLFDEILSKGASAASPVDLANGVARQVLGEKLKESYDATRSDSPFHEVIANSALANVSGKKLENIKFEYDQVLLDFGRDHAAQGALDKPFDPAAFKDSAIAAAKLTIEKYTI